MSCGQPEAPSVTEVQKQLGGQVGGPVRKGEELGTAAVQGAGERG